MKKVLNLSIALLVLAGLAIPIAGMDGCVKTFHKLSKTSPCFVAKELCTDGKDCQYFALRERCPVHPWRRLQFREFREQKELASNTLMDKELATNGKYDWESHKKDVAGREWNRRK